MARRTPNDAASISIDVRKDEANPAYDTAPTLGSFISRSPRQRPWESGSQSERFFGLICKKPNAARSARSSARSWKLTPHPLVRKRIAPQRTRRRDRPTRRECPFALPVPLRRRGDCLAGQGTTGAQVGRGTTLLRPDATVRPSTGREEEHKLQEDRKLRSRQNLWYQVN